MSDEPKPKESARERIQKQAVPKEDLKVTFFDSTVAITAYNVIALSPGPMQFEAIGANVKFFFGERVLVEPEQLLGCLKNLEERKFLSRSDAGWDVTHPERAILRRRVRPNPNDPKSGWDGLGFAKLKRMPEGLG